MGLSLCSNSCLEFCCSIGVLSQLHLSHLTELIGEPPWLAVLAASPLGWGNLALRITNQCAYGIANLVPLQVAWSSLMRWSPGTCLAASPCWSLAPSRSWRLTWASMVRDWTKPWWPSDATSCQSQSLMLSLSFLWGHLMATTRSDMTYMFIMPQLTISNLQLAYWTSPFQSILICLVPTEHNHLKMTLIIWFVITSFWLQSHAPDYSYHITYTVEPMLELLWRAEDTQVNTWYKVLFPITTPLMPRPPHVTESKSASLVVKAGCIVLNCFPMFSLNRCLPKYEVIACWSLIQKWHWSFHSYI